jgi:hypothetical protein
MPQHVRNNLSRLDGANPLHAVARLRAREPWQIAEFSRLVATFCETQMIKAASVENS